MTETQRVIDLVQELGNKTLEGQTQKLKETDGYATLMSYLRTQIKLITGVDVVRTETLNASSICLGQSKEEVEMGAAVAVTQLILADPHKYIEFETENDMLEGSVIRAKMKVVTKL